MTTHKKHSSLFYIIFVSFFACFIYSMSAGLRSNYGILINPISQNTGISYATISFILAIAN